MHINIANRQPQVSVGIVSAKRIKFRLNAPYMVNDSNVAGNQSIGISGGKIMWNGVLYDELTFYPQSPAASFSLYDVTIGINFHWERKETQTFLGTLRFIIDADKICAINELSVETYLESVISSEMSATASIELLEAHAVISRSWLLAQIGQKGKSTGQLVNSSTCQLPHDEQIRWYDRKNHTLFDVCADDHCQRYQGITKQTSVKVAEAIKTTYGQVLMYDGEICDARFSKCCGGVSEEYQYCWENSPKPYLKAVRDEAVNADATTLPDLSNEAEADRWIRSKPQAFCDTHDKHVLSQVLNDYDQETTDFYRWRVEYTQEELSALISGKLNMDFGEILDLISIERGKSGRISKLKIVGTKKTLIIGKELEIRKALSNTHLYSSAFVVDKYYNMDDTSRHCEVRSNPGNMDKGDIINNIPARFVITGAGWGHGVGLCQIGAAVMGERGYNYEEILLHYYKGAEIKQIYK